MGRSDVPKGHDDPNFAMNALLEKLPERIKLESLDQFRAQERRILWAMIGSREDAPGKWRGSRANSRFLEPSRLAVEKSYGLCQIPD